MLEQLLNSGRVWKGKDQKRSSQKGISSGYSDIDMDLPDGGWCQGVLTELIVEQPGSGELRLLLPLLARLSQQPGWILWVAPPLQPYAPALSQAGVRLSQLLIVRPHDLKQRLWAMEQGLRGGGCSAVLGWLDIPDHTSLRRLQLAADEGDCFGFLFRSPAAAVEASSAHLRIQLAPATRGSFLTMLKRRRSWPLPPRLSDLGYRRTVENWDAFPGHNKVPSEPHTSLS